MNCGQSVPEDCETCVTTCLNTTISVSYFSTFLLNTNINQPLLFNRKILTSLYLKSETSAHAQPRNYLFTPWSKVSLHVVSWKLILWVTLDKCVMT